jgi:concentrative nucleoside transporter, CNT family
MGQAESILRGIIGIFSILGIAWIFSSDRKAINYRLVASGLALQFALAVFILKTDTGKYIFGKIGSAITKVLDYASVGGRFVFGAIAKPELMGKVFGPENAVIFSLTVLIPTIIFVCVLVAIGYYFGIIQKVVELLAKAVHTLMRVSGAEALSNVASAFVGQVEAQIMIRPYLSTMTRSELLASMAGSMACIAGGVMAIYITFGIPASALLAASLMAAPGALVISKIFLPETEESQTKGQIKLEVKKEYANLIDAISGACSDGLRIALNVIAMIVGFLALIALLDGILGKIGGTLNYFAMMIEAKSGMNLPDFDLTHISLKSILSIVFAGFAWLMGVPSQDVWNSAQLLGTKFVANEFVAYLDLVQMKDYMDPKSFLITSIALCGFANLSSVGIQIGGISVLVPERRAELSELGMKALICGTLASYLSATIAGMLM